MTDGRDSFTLRGGRLYDPVNGRDGTVQDLHVRSGRIVAAEGGVGGANGGADTSGQGGGGAAVDIDVRGMVVMGGGIEMHTHIGGG
ncbi:MAG TPA: hypothetical protein VEY69_00490, partial [Lautropia sp.]|nr:hypothetical protein [Lautropia sp.]